MRIPALSIPGLLLTAIALSGCFAHDRNEASVWRDDVTQPIKRNITLDLNEATHVLKTENGRTLSPGMATKTSLGRWWYSWVHQNHLE